MSNPLFNIQYGLFIITTCDAGKDNGCISNTVAQVTAQPNRIRTYPALGQVHGLHPQRGCRLRTVQALRLPERTYG